MIHFTFAEIFKDRFFAFFAEYASERSLKMFHINS